MKRDDEQEKRLWECQKLLFKADELFQNQYADVVINVLTWLTAQYIHGTVDRKLMDEKKAFDAVFLMIRTAYFAQKEDDND